MINDPWGNQVLLEGQVVPNAWDVYQKRCNGHSELSFKPVISWTESDTMPEDYVPKNAKYTAANLAIELEEKRAKQREKNAQRAKSQCRWVIKSQGLNELLTLTYRDNQEDRDLCKKHFKEWVRRMKAALGGDFVYCASFEKQTRGAMHVHVACKKLPEHGTLKGQKIKAWRLGTDIWRSIIGLSATGETGGLCFVGGKTRNGGYRRNLSLAKLAGYVSKYIMKDYADSPLEKNRYSRSDGLTLPKAVKTTYTGLTLAEMIDLVFECSQGDVIVSHRVTLDDYGCGRYWLVTEPDLSKR
jgi:hypothetical protein